MKKACLGLGVTVQRQDKKMRQQTQQTQHTNSTKECTLSKWKMQRCERNETESKNKAYLSHEDVYHQDTNALCVCVCNCQEMGSQITEKGTFYVMLLSNRLKSVLSCG